MREQIYLSKYIDSIKMDLIIKEDEHSIWANLLDLKNDDKIIMDGFVCSTGTIVKQGSDVKDFIDKGFAPSISEDYADNRIIHDVLTENDFEIEVSDDKVNIFLKDVRVVILDFGNRISYSKSVSKPGPYGVPIISTGDNK